MGAQPAAQIGPDGAVGADHETGGGFRSVKPR